MCNSSGGKQLENSTAANSDAFTVAVALATMLCNDQLVTMTEMASWQPERNSVMQQSACGKAERLELEQQKWLSTSKNCLEATINTV